MNYGAWVKPDGEVIDIAERCGHEFYCSYADAHDEGWIALTYGPAWWGIRFNPQTVTRAALRAARLLVLKSRMLSFVVEDLFAIGFEGVTLELGEREVLGLLTLEKARTLERRY